MLEDKQNISGNAVIEWDGEEFQNNANLRRLEKSFDVLYKLKTPKYREKQSFVAEVAYNGEDEHHNIT